MKYKITEYDKSLILQTSLQYPIKIIITNVKRNIMDTLTGISEIGSSNIDPASNIRRTLSFTLKLDDFIENIEDKIASWIGYYYEVNIGIIDERTDETVFYPYGRYVITEASTVYDRATNSLTMNLSDRMCELDGTRNGQDGGAPIIEIPKEKDGVKQTLRGTVVNILTSSTKVDKYVVDDIGEFNGMSFNEGYMEYREKNKEWNVLPYDLSYSSGALISDMLFEIRDLYPNCQMYFDVYDNFCFDMIPSLESDLPELDYDYIERILLADSSESTSYDITSIKNVTEIFGKTYDIDRFCEKSSYTSNTYTLQLDLYDKYNSYEMIAFTPTANNTQNCYFKINSLEALPIYYEYTETPISPSTIVKDDMCVIRLVKQEQKFVAYYLGQYQPHALCVLTNNVNDNFYTKSYFSKKYNVKEKNIVFREEPFSRFSVQQLGEILDSKSGNEFDNILSDSNAMENAKYFNRMSSTMFDTVTITTLLLPWLDVNVKINYRKLQENVVYSYIVKSKSDDFSSGTSTITMYRFMQLYER